MHMYLVHTFPSVCLWLTLKTIHFNLSENHWFFLATFGIIYAIINYFETKARGRWVYPFLTWEDHNTLIIVFVILSGSSLLWIALARCTQHTNSNNNKEGKKTKERES